MSFFRKITTISLSFILVFGLMPFAYSEEGEVSLSDSLDQEKGVSVHERISNLDNGQIENAIQLTLAEQGKDLSLENPYQQGSQEALDFDRQSLEKVEYNEISASLDWDELVPDREYEAGSILVGLRHGVSADEARDMLVRHGLSLRELIPGTCEEDTPIAYADIFEGVKIEDVVYELYGDPGVLYAEPNWIHKRPKNDELQDIDIRDKAVYNDAGSCDLSLDGAKNNNLRVDDEGDPPIINAQSFGVNDPSAKDQWYLDAINIREAWDFSRSSGKVTVAVLDSGIDMSHPDLENNIDKEHARDIPGDRPLSDDDYNHGTRAAGIICGEVNNGIGIAGVSYNAKVIPIKITDKKLGSWAATDVNVAKAVNYLIDLKISNLRVINFSYGGVYPYSISQQNIVDRAYAHGMAFVCSAGNEHINTKDHYYANLKHSISVAAVSKDKSLASFSNYGTGVDISAPGVEMFTTTNRSDPTSDAGSYAFVQGTSFSAPVVSGVLALMFAYDSELTVDAAENIVEQTAIKVDGTTGYGPIFGWGMVDAKAALKRLSDRSGKPTVEHAQVTGVGDARYTGSPITPDPTVSVDGKVLKKGVDYTVFYRDNVNPRSNAEVVITGIGKYTGVTKVEFYIQGKWKRLNGLDALKSMRNMVVEGSWGSGESMIITTSGGYWDALTANGLAGVKRCPVLMSNGSSLSKETKDLIELYKPSKIYVIGGSAAISDHVFGQIKSIKFKNGASPSVRRIFGSDAPQTAVEIYKEGKDSGSWSKTAVIATTGSFQDALSISPYSYAKKSPIFLAVPGSPLDSLTVQAIRSGGFDRVVICGGAAAVSSSVEGQLKGISAVRLAGPDCFGTSLQVANWCIENGMVPNNVGVATGFGYHDAVCGAGICGSKNAPIVLVSDSYHDTIDGFIKPRRHEIQNGYIFGGEAAVSYATEIALNKALL